MQSSRKAILIQRLKTIRTHKLKAILGMWSYWLASTHHLRKMLTNDFKVIMPRTWTPKMYLGALNQSIRWMNSLLALESINVSGRNYTTMNKLNWLFPFQKGIIHMRLVTFASYLHLYGGEFQNKTP
jgi:hypothetical protein